MKILYVNAVEDLTPVPSTENSNFKFTTAFDDTRLTRFGKFTGYTSENIKWGSTTPGIDVTDVLIANNNITSSGVVKFQANIIDDFTSPPIDVTLARQTNGYYYYNVGTITPDQDNRYVDENGDFYVDQSGNYYVDFDQANYLYCRFVITDPTNTEPVKLSKAFVGTSITMPGMTPTSELPINTTSVVNQTDSGQIYADKRTQIKGANVSFPVITESQRQDIITFFNTVDITDPFYLLIWESDLDVEPPLYATLTEPPKFKKLRELLWSLNFGFIENK